MNNSEHSIGAFEAKTHFSRVLNRVEQGETIAITRHGHTIARLVPVEHNDRKQVEAAMDSILSRRKRLGKASIQDLIGTIHEGHRQP